MAAPQAGGERDRHRGRQLGAAEELDVVVLGRDEALPLPLRLGIDGAAELEEDGALVERKIGVGVRHLDGPRSLARRPVPEPPLIRPARHVRDDIELLLRLLERALEPQVVVRRHDQLMRNAALAQQRRQRREQPVNGLGLDRRLEPVVQLVPEATGATHRRHVLADTGQVERAVARVVERRREALRKRRRAREAEHGDDAARQERLDDLVVDLRRPAVATRGTRADRRVLAQDPRLQVLQAPARLDAELADERAARVLVGLERLRLAARAVEGLHQQLTRPLAQRLLGDERLELRDDVGVPPELGVGTDPLLARDKA